MPKMHRNRSVMKHSFAQVPRAEIPRSTFDRSHGHKTTFDAGWLVPVFLDEGLPGDTFKVSSTMFARLATPVFPIMDNMVMDVHFFAVPVRLVWDNWVKFNGEQVDPGDSTDFTVPQMVSTASTGYGEMSLHDYMGIPTKVPDLSHSSLFHRAYNLVYNTWYRDQNMQDSVVVDRDDGPDDPADYVLLRRGKRHDYFTASLPWPQKGDAVTFPIGATNAPVVSDGTEPTFHQSATAWKTVSWDATAGLTGGAPQGVGAFSNDGVVWGRSDNTAATGLEVDLSSVTGSTINQLRQAFAIQKILERDARGGTRYIEVIKAHFGVTSPDARLQRPEYLGGGSFPVNINPVAQTSAVPSQPSPQGNLAAFGTALGQAGFTASFTEHVLILGIASVRADLTYQQGLNRMFSRLTRYDFYWPALAHIGEQTVLNKELYAVGSATPGQDDQVFGYQERHAEYRYKPSQITGLFRSNATASLDAWHLSQEFGSLPTLDNDFIVENPPLDRVIAVPAEPHFLFDSYFRMHCARPMPVFGVPGMIDHF